MDGVQPSASSKKDDKTKSQIQTKPKRVAAPARSRSKPRDHRSSSSCLLVSAIISCLSGQGRGSIADNGVSSCDSYPLPYDLPGGGVSFDPSTTNNFFQLPTHQLTHASLPNYQLSATLYPKCCYEMADGRERDWKPPWWDHNQSWSRQSDWRDDAQHNRGGRRGRDEGDEKFATAPLKTRSDAGGEEAPAVVRYGRP